MGNELYASGLFGVMDTAPEQPGNSDEADGAILSRLTASKQPCYV